MVSVCKEGLRQHRQRCDHNKQKKDCIGSGCFVYAFVFLFVPFCQFCGFDESDTYVHITNLTTDIDLLRAIMHAIDKHESINAWEGVVYTMNIRFWEFDPKMKKYLQRSQAHAIDMETATLFVASMRRRLKIAAFHLVSDLPLTAVKDKAAAKRIIRSLGPEHVKAACDVLKQALVYKSHREDMYEQRVIRKRETEKLADLNDNGTDGKSNGDESGKIFSSVSTQ